MLEIIRYIPCCPTWTVRVCTTAVTLVL